MTLFSFCNEFAYSQSEEEMKVNADKYFSESKYLEATPLYMRLLSLNPDDYNLNYRYGACLLFNSNKKQEAAKYLSYSIQNPNATPENHYFLGRALQYSYLFGDAISEYNIYLQNRSKPEFEFPVERDIEMCQNGKRLLASVTDLIVLDKKEITTDKFFRIYDLKDIGGSLIVTTDFQTKLDKKNNHTPLIHFPQSPSIVFYSSYGENGNQGKDIYYRKKLIDGTWSDATLVEGKVNTQFDEDFPYLDPAGDFLYFSSKGHNSMGGYDVFRSKFDASTGLFSAPENLDFAISSPDDDVLFIVDSLNQNAYFASARQSEIGKLHVYKVMMERVPIQMVVLKGSFVSEKNPASKLISIEVSDASGNKIIGNFNSDENGDYSITLPKGGNYEYVMKLDGNSQEFRSQVQIPISEGFKPYKQVIRHLDENNLEVVKVINLFDEVVDNQQELLAEVIRKRSALDVNISEFDLNKIASLKADRAILNEIGLSNLSLNEVIDVLEQQTLKNEQNNTLAANISNNVNNLVVENKTEFLRLEEAIKDKLAAANNLNNADDKYRALKEAENLIKVQNELKKYSEDLLRLSDSVNNVLSDGLSQEEQEQLDEATKNYSSLYNEGKEQEALAVLASNKDLIQKSLNNTSGNIVQNLVDKSVQLDEMNALTQSKIDTYKDQVSALKIEIVKLESTLEDAKKKDISAIENQIASKNEEIDLIQDEVLVLQKTVDNRILEKYTIDKQIDLLQDAISNKSLLTVTRNAANKAVSETEKTNSNTLVSYVAQQVKTLEDADPTLKERIIVTNGLNTEELYKQYLANNQGITDDSNLNKETKLFKQLTSDRAAVKQLDDRLAEIDKMIAQGKGNEVLEDEKSALLSYKEKVLKVQNERESEVAKILAKEGVGDKETVINGLKSDYIQNKTFIENNSNFSLAEKNKALDKEDEALLSSVEAELKKVESSLVKTPNDQVLLIKQNSLNEIKASLEKDIASRKEIRNEGDQVIASKESLVQTLDQDYSKKIEAINSSSSISDMEKNTGLNTIDSELVQKVEKELSTLEKQIKADPNNVSLQERQIQLNELKSEKEKSIQQRNAENSLLTVDQITQESLIEKINPTYQETIDAINSNSLLSTDEKKLALNTADSDLINKTDSALKIIDKDLIENPSDKLLIEEKAVLLDLKQQKEAAIEERNQTTGVEIEKIISALPNYNLSQEKIELINQLNPDYIDRVLDIQGVSQNINTQIAKQLIDSDVELLEDLKAEKNNTTKELQNNPESVALKEKLKRIIDLEGDAIDRLMANNKIVENEEVQIAISSIDVSDKRSILLKETDQKIQLLKADLSLSEIEKQEAIVKEKNNGIGLVEVEIKNLEEKKNLDPLNQSNQKALEIADLLKTELESELALEQQKLDSIIKINVSNTQTDTSDGKSEIDKKNESTVITEQSILKELMPDYQLSKTRTLEDKQLSQKDKNEALLILENTFNAKLKDEKLSLINILNTNPDATELKDKLVLIEAMELTSNEELSKLKSAQFSNENNDLANENISALVNQVAPDYNVKKLAIMDSKMEESKKLIQLIKLEEDLVRDLNTSLEEVEKRLISNPEDQKALKDKETIINAISTHETELENYNELLNELRKVSDKENLIATIDKSYYDDIDKLNDDNTLNTFTEKISREEELQVKLIEKQSENNTILLSKDNPELVRENALIDELLEESKARIADLNLMVSPVQKKTDFIQEIRMNAFDNSEIPSNYNSVSLEELLTLEKTLQAYNTSLTDLESEKTRILKENPNDKMLSSQIEWIAEERNLLSAQQEKLKLTIEALQNANQPIVQDIEYQDKELVKLKADQEEIENKLAKNDLSKKEEKQLNLELEQVNEAKNYRINEILTDKIDELSQSNQILKNQIESSNEMISDDDMKLASNYEQSGQEYIDLAAKTKSLDEKNNLLKQGYQEQLQANDILMNAVFDAKIKAVESELATSVLNLNEKKEQLEKLETQNRLVGVQIENLESEKSNAKKRDLEFLNEDIIVKKTEQKVIKDKIEILEDEIKTLESKETKPTLEEISTQIDITFEEEIKLAQSKDYANYFEFGSKAVIQENKVLQLEAEIDALRDDLKNEISNAVADGSELNKDLVIAKTVAINLKVEELSKAKTELIALQKSAENKLPTDRNLALKMQNMTNRGVLPINVEKIAVASLNLPVSGIIIDTNSGNALAALKNLPLDLKTPSGLVYRVQVGAFSKPIPKDLFKEFAPVTTELIPNSNITRYLAGYFSSSDKATVARDQIRGLGYVDAFIIAYCDGVRITIAEAKRLEASGECLPKKEDELALEVTTNVVQQLGLDTAEVIDDIDAYDYNKAVGAAKAEAAEKHLGLFYTVQVGVFLHPVNAATVRELSPLMTERLNNGTIRYSVGMFQTAADARPTKLLANEKGISDAFITAYYNGKRISVKEAESLIEKNGLGILEPLKSLEIEKLDAVGAEDSLNNIEEIMSYDNTKEIEVVKSNPKIYQIVTKKQFNEFPRDVLNRYNMKGQFYFDEQEGIVKSNLFDEKDEIPSVYYFQDDIDTLIYEDSSAIDYKHIRINCDDEIPGDLMDWLNKINLRKEFYWKENGIEICIFDNDETRLKLYENDLKSFGLSYEYVVPEKFK